MDRVLVFPTKFADGAEALRELDSRHPTASHEAQVCTLDEMLSSNYSTDAHFVSYLLIDPDGDLYERPVKGAQFKAAARINKAALHSVREAGWRLVAWGAVLDYDIKDNVTPDSLMAEGKGWTQSRLEDFSELCGDVREVMEEKGLSIHTIYRTNHGARFIHRYDQLLDVEDHEEVLEGLRKTYLSLGLAMDEACSDWTRLMRAPRVMRDNVPTWEPAWFACGSDPDAWASTTLAPRSQRERAANKAHVPEYAGDKPTPEECIALFAESANSGKGQQKKTELYKKLRTKVQRIGDDDLYEALVHMTPYPFEHGQVNVDMTRLVGQLCGRLYNEEYMDGPEPIYAMLLPGAQELPQDNPWEDILWSLCIRMWTGEAGQARAKEIEEEKVEEETRDKTDILLDRLRVLYPATPIDRAWAMQHAVAKKGGSAYLMQPDGTYHSYSVDVDTLPNKVRASEMEFLITLEEMRGNQVNFVSGRDIIKMYGFTVSNIRGVPGSHSSTGGVLTEGSTMCMPIFRPKKWEPRFDNNVDSWLRASFGEDYPKVMKWLAFCQVWDRPIAGLAVIGPRSAGKSLLVDGLSELIAGNPLPSGAAELVGEYTPGLGRSPIICVNEGASMSFNKASNMADRYRQLITGDPMWVNEKYKAQVELRVPFRILFTANNMGVIDALAEGQTLNIDDQEALKERLILSRMTHAGTEWFAANNINRCLTDQWVGEGSQHLLARHLVALYTSREERYGEPHSARLLVSGTDDARFDELADRLRTGDRKTEEVMGNVLGILAMAVPPTAVCEAMAVDANGVYITAPAILMYHQITLKTGKQVDLTTSGVGRCLGNISSSQVAVRGRRKTLAGNMRNLRWHTLDLGLIERTAIEYGLDWDQIQENLQRHVISQVDVRTL